MARAARKRKAPAEGVVRVERVPRREQRYLVEPYPDAAAGCNLYWVRGEHLETRAVVADGFVSKEAAQRHVEHLLSR